MSSKPVVLLQAVLVELQRVESHLVEILCLESIAPRGASSRLHKRGRKEGEESSAHTSDEDEPSPAIHKVR